MSEEEGSCSHVKDDLKWGVGEGNNLEFLTSMSAVLPRSVCAFESIAKFDRKNKPFKHTSIKRNLKLRPIACSRHTMHYRISPKPRKSIINVSLLLQRPGKTTQPAQRPEGRSTS